MPRTSSEAKAITAYAITSPPPAPPSILTQEQQNYWRTICEGLPAGQIRSDNTPTLIELVRHMSYASQIAQELATMRDAILAQNDRDGKTQRAVFIKLLQDARAESALIAMLSVKLRFTVQSRDDDVIAARRRARSPTTGRRPWEPLDKAQDDGGGLDS